MDTQLLKAFLAVADQRSFSLAAEHLYLTQPAISKRIALLEQQLDCRLFDRIGRKVFLTEAGSALLPRARNILASVEDAQRAMGNLSGHVGGKLQLATSHHIGLHRLPPFLRRYTQMYPRVALALEFMDSEVAFDAIQRGALELAVITLGPEMYACDSICPIPLWEDPLFFVVNDDHPLIECETIDLETLSQFPAVLPSANTHTSQLVVDLFQHQQLPLQRSMNTNYLETIKMLVGVGLGWSVLPETLIDGGLKRLQVSSVKLSRQLGCIYHRDRTLSNAGLHFLQLLQSDVN